MFEGHQHLVVGDKPIRLLCFLSQNQEPRAQEVILGSNLPGCFLQLGPTFPISLSPAGSEYRNLCSRFYKPQNKVAGANQAWWLLWEGSTRTGAKEKWTWPLPYEIQRGFPEITVDKVKSKAKKKTWYRIVWEVFILLKVFRVTGLLQHRVNLWGEGQTQSPPAILA